MTVLMPLGDLEEEPELPTLLLLLLLLLLVGRGRISVLITWHGNHCPFFRCGVQSSSPRGWCWRKHALGARRGNGCARNFRPPLRLLLPIQVLSNLAEELLGVTLRRPHDGRVRSSLFPKKAKELVTLGPLSSSFEQSSPYDTLGRSCCSATTATLESASLPFSQRGT